MHCSNWINVNHPLIYKLQKRRLQILLNNSNSDFEVMTINSVFCPIINTVFIFPVSKRLLKTINLIF